MDFIANLFHSDTELQAVTEKRSFRRSQFVYQSGQSPEGIYFVEEGLVGLSKEGPSGKLHFLRFFRRGQVFGHRAILADEIYHANTQVLEDTTLLFVRTKDILKMFENRIELYHRVVKQLAQELQHCENQQINLLDQQVMPRLAQSIVYLKELHPTYRWTRSELSAFCGSTTATVIKALAELEYMGYIKQKGRDIEILDRQALIQMG